MLNEIQFNKTPDQNQFVLKVKEMDLEAGWLGKCFGTSKNSPLNIAGFVLIILVVAGVLVLFIQSSIAAIDYWKIVSPLIALVMGFVFGKGSSGN
jgi:hypothetical protein